MFLEICRLTDSVSFLSAQNFHSKSVFFSRFWTGMRSTDLGRGLFARPPPTMLGWRRADEGGGRAGGEEGPNMMKRLSLRFSLGVFAVRFRAASVARWASVRICGRGVEYVEPQGGAVSHQMRFHACLVL